ncbi:hypothetical protein, partial [Mycobacterium branderi]|uniref:hypothetical protein n=1 Tax=Mycobacterium branderi TaxID=43348 RepID=UPI00361F0D80
SEKPDYNKTKTTPQPRGSQGMAKTTTNKTTKHTIEFSNNTHEQATLPLYSATKARSTPVTAPL